MANSNYIIAVDESGQPYIAHAFGFHKYFHKIRNGDRTRYFYTREQFDAFLRRLRGEKRRIVRRDRPASRQKNITGYAKEGWSKRRTFEHQRGETAR